MGREVRQHSLYVLPLFVLGLVAYPVWLSHGLPTANDLGALNIPQRLYLASCYRHLSLPFWNPYNFGGQSFLAAGQSGPLYLPNVLFVLFPISFALKSSYIFHNVLILGGMYLLVYHLTKSKLGAFLSAFAFLTSGFFVGHQIHTQMYDAVAWLPLVCYLFLKASERMNATRTLLLGTAFSEQFYAGHPQMSFHTLLILGLYSLLQLIVKKNAVILKPWLGIFVGLLLSSPQWLETAHFTLLSNRVHEPSWFLLAGSMNPKYLLQTVFPFVPWVFHMGVFWEYLSYFGVVVLIIGSSAIILQSHKVKEITVWTAVGLGFVVLALGGYFIFSAQFAHLPGFDLFRIPARYVDAVIFAMSILAGYGVALAESSKRFTQTVAWIAGISIVSIGAAYQLGAFHGWSRKVVAFTVLWMFLALAVSLLFRNHPKCAAYGLAGVAVFELLAWSVVASPYIKQGATRWNATYYTNPTPSPAVAYVSSHLKGPYPFYRVADLESVGQPSSLTLDRSLYYNIPVLNGEDSLESKWYLNSVDLMWSPNTLTKESKNVLDDYDVQFLITSATDSSYVQTHEPAEWRKVFADMSSIVWENKDDISPARVGPGGSATLASWHVNSQTWNVDCTETGVLTISQSFDPNWQVFVNGRKTNVFPADNMLIGANIPQGHSVVTLRYVPMWFYFGCALSALTLLGFAVALFVKLTRVGRFIKTRRPRGPKHEEFLPI